MRRNSYRALDYEFGKQVQALRKKVRITQKELAQLMGVSKRSVLNWEAGSSYPKTTRLYDLVEILLRKGAFTPGQEEKEAEFFWEKATPNKGDSKDAFNRTWFRGLFQINSNNKEGSSEVSASVATNPQRQLSEDWGDALEPPALYGRETELSTLEDWVNGNKRRVIAVFGMGGIGKTALVLTFAHRLADRFDFIFFRSLRTAPPLAEILTSLIDLVAQPDLVEMPHSNADKLVLLMQYLQHRRGIIILDNFETVMQTGLQAGYYQTEYRDYSTFITQLAEITHQSHLILTSREKPSELGLLEGRSSTVSSLILTGLDPVAARQMLSGWELNATLTDWQLLVKRYSGNPLALHLLGEVLHGIFAGNLSAFLASESSIFGGVRFLLDQHFDRLSEVEQDLMYWLAIEQIPTSLETLQRQSILKTGRRSQLEALVALSRRFLVEQTEHEALFTLQPVVMEYVCERLVTQIYSEISQMQPLFLCRYSLSHAGNHDYVRQNQLNVLVRPLLSQLLDTFKSVEILEAQLRTLLEKVRKMPRADQGYAGTNILTLLLYAGCDLGGWDFSDLNLWQAHLAEVALNNVNMQGADLEGSVFTENLAVVYTLAFSPDGKLLATGSSNAEIKIWQASPTGSFSRLILECSGHTDLVKALAFSPDSTMLASCSNDGTVRIWEITYGTCLAVLKGHTGVVRTVVFSPDGKMLASGGDDATIRLWRVATSELINTIKEQESGIMSVAFHPDGRILASASLDGSVSLWDVSIPEEAPVKASSTLKGHHGWVSSVVFSPDGTLLATGGADKILRVWWVATGKCKVVLEGHSGAISSVAFHPDANTIATASTDQTIRLWSVTAAECLTILSEHSSAIMSVAFHPHGKNLVSTDEGSCIRFWSIKPREVLSTLQSYLNQIYSIAVSPDGQWLVAAGFEKLLLKWPLLAGNKQIPFQILTGHTSYAVAVTFSPDSKILASAGADGTVRLWKITENRCWRVLSGHQRTVTCVAFSCSGNVIASGSEDGTIKVWSAISGECLVTFETHQAMLRTLTFSYDGDLLASSGDDGLIQLFQIEQVVTKSYLKTSWKSQTKFLLSLAFAPNSHLLASAGDDGMIRLWDIQTSECITTLQGHQGYVWSIVFSPAGHTLASGGDDGIVRLWDIKSESTLANFDHKAKVLAVAFTVDGARLISAGEGGFIQCWEIASQTLLTTFETYQPYKGLNIKDVRGLLPAQRLTLLALGAQD